MTVYAVGGEADCFYPETSQTYAYETTGAGTRYNSTLSRGAMKITQAASELYLNFNANVATSWIHMFLYQEVVAGAVDDWIQINKLDGSPAFRIGLNADGTWDLDKWKSGAWTNLSTTSGSVLSSSGGAIDIYINVHASTGEVSIYKDGVQASTYSGDTSIDNLTFGQIHWKGQTGAANEMNLSQVIASSENTIGWVLHTLTPNGNSATNTAWTGVYTNIDEFQLDTADYIEAIATNLVETSTLTDIDASFASYNVKAVAVAMRASNDTGSVVNDLQAAIRVSSTNYFSPNLSLPKDGLDYSRYYIWDQNPNTTAAWSQAAVNALEAGVKSV